MRLKPSLLLVAERLRALNGMAESRLSKLLFGNGNRLALLRRGGDMQSANVEDGLARLSALWPEGEPWPGPVPRPDPLAPRPLPEPRRRRPADVA